MVVLIDTAGCLLEVGPSMERVLGHPPDSLLGRSCFDLLHPDDRLLALQGLGNALVHPGRPLEPMLTRVADASGAWRPVEVLARNLVDDPGVGGVVVTLRDRSGADEVEREIAEREDRYRQIAEVALEGVWCLDEGNRTTFVTGPMAVMLGYTVPEMLARPLWDFIHDDDRLLAEELLSRHQRGLRQEFSFRFRHRSGRDVWTRVSTTPVEAHDRNFVGSIALVSDVTEHRLDQQRLAATEAREQAIVHALPDRMFRMAADGMILAYQTGREAPPSDFAGLLVGRTVRQSFGDDIGATAESAIGEALSTGAVTSFSCDVETVHGPRSFEVRVSSVDAGEVITLVRDVTDLQRAERDRAEYVREFQRREAAEERVELDRGMARAARLEALGRLAGGVAHDMNNLLGVIANYSAAIRQSTGEETTVADVTEIERVVRRGTQLTKRLLLFGRQDGATSEVQDLVRVADGVCHMLERIIDPSYELRADLPEEPHWVAVDRWQFEQAVINLVLNAQDAAPAGTRIVVSVGARGDDVVLSVRDQGPGMSPEVQERAFEPFFTTKESGRGTGLGLAVVHGIAVEAGGSVRIDSPAGGGTLVSIVVPGAAPPGVAEPPPVGPGDRARDLRPRRLLVVDDEEDARRSMTRMLESRGFEVVVAGSGQVALDLLTEALDVDVVLSDVAMPGVTGPELARRLREFRPDLPVVLLTGYGAHLVDGLPADVPLLAKPLVIDDLVDTLSGLLSPA